MLKFSRLGLYYSWDILMKVPALFILRLKSLKRFLRRKFMEELCRSVEYDFQMWQSQSLQLFLNLQGSYWRSTELWKWHRGCWAHWVEAHWLLVALVNKAEALQQPFLRTIKCSRRWNAVLWKPANTKTIHERTLQKVWFFSSMAGFAFLNTAWHTVRALANCQLSRNSC